MRLPLPTSRRQVVGLFLLAPPIFAFLGGALSLMYSYAALAPEALAELGAEVFWFALWIGAVCASAGLLYAWILTLAARGAPGGDEEESARLKAFVADPEEEAAPE